jgi:hypothetical protein
MKCRLTFKGIHCATSQKTELFITTAVRTPNYIILYCYIHVDRRSFQKHIGKI